MSNYLYNEAELCIVKSTLKLIDEKMSESYNKATQLNSNLENSSWKGQAKDAMVAYTDLLVQFHNRFQGEDSPIKNATNEFAVLIDRLEDFYKFEEFINITKI